MQLNRIFMELFDLNILNFDLNMLNIWCLIDITIFCYVYFLNLLDILVNVQQII